MFASATCAMYSLAMGERRKITAFISLDVEEEGLFGGKYRRSNVSVTNVPLIRKLEPIFSEFGLPLTLFCAHPVFMDKDALDAILWAREFCGAEIGLHLHHWSSPPLSPRADENLPPERTHTLPRELLAEKLRILAKTCETATGERPESFRMGRWDLKSSLFPLLTEIGIKTDCSVSPLRIFKGGPDHFFAPSDPYWVELRGGEKILEVPVTQLPLFASLPRVWRNICRANVELADKFHFFGALSCNPLWHAAPVMRLAARLLAARGGKVISFFWHSSELLPGASPHTRSAADREKLLKKIFKFCAWLKKNFDLQGATAKDLYNRGSEFPVIEPRGGGDWR